MAGEWTFFDFFAGAGGLGLAFRTAGSRCVGLLEPSSLWGTTARMNLAQGEEPDLVAIGRQATLKPAGILARLGGRRPDVLLAQPLWPAPVTQGGKPRKDLFLAPPNDWFGDPRNLGMGKVLAMVQELAPRVVLLPHIARVASRRDLGLLALHCTALHKLGYTVLPAQLNDAWYGAPVSCFRIVVLAVKNMRPADVALYWPPDRLFQADEPDPSWVHSTRKSVSLLDSWWPLAPPEREGLPPSPTLIESFEDLPPAAFPWPGGTAPLDQEIPYTRTPHGWYARLLRKWFRASRRLTMHVCIPDAWRGPHKNPNLHVGWLSDVLWRKECIEARHRGRTPPDRGLSIPLPEVSPEARGREKGEWVQMPPPPVPGTPPLLWQDRFLRLFTGGSPERTFSLREEARLRSFPDSWRFAGSFLERLGQILQAYPPLAGLVAARAVLALLERRTLRESLLPECPLAPPPRSPEERRRVEGMRGHTGELPFA